LLVDRKTKKQIERTYATNKYTGARKLYHKTQLDVNVTFKAIYN